MMEYNDLLTLEMKSLDGRSNYGGIAHSNVLYEFMRTEKGKQQFRNMYEQQQVLAMYTVSLLRTTGNSSYIDFVAFNFEEILLSLCLKPCYKELLVKYLNGTMLFKQNDSSINDNNAIVTEWFDEKAIVDKSNRKMNQQKEMKNKLLYIFICLVGSDRDAQLHLAKSWDGKKGIFVTQKKGLLKKYIIQLNTAPASTIPTTTPR